MSLLSAYQAIASRSAAVTRAAPRPPSWLPAARLSQLPLPGPIWALVAAKSSAKEVLPLREMTLRTASPLICCTPMLARARFWAGAEPCPRPRSRSERAPRNPTASQSVLTTSSSEARTSPGLKTRRGRRGRPPPGPEGGAAGQPPRGRVEGDGAEESEDEYGQGQRQPVGLAAGRTDGGVLAGEDVL